MRRFVAAAGILNLAIFGPALPVSAETLPIESLYPAGNDSLAALNSLAMAPFSGPDGEAFRIEVEQKLREATLQGTPYFSMVPLRGKPGPDGIIGGSARGGSESRSESVKRQECASRDGKGKCVEKRWVQISCTRRTDTLSYTLTVDGRRRERIFSSAKTASSSYLICPDAGGAPSSEEAIAALVTKVAIETRLLFAPLEVRNDIRVKEGVEGLQNNAKQKFKQAIRLTKTSAQAACNAWGEVDQLVPSHAPTLFNMGLCAEMRRDFVAAQAHFKQAVELDPAEAYTIEALARIERRRQADRQIAAHFSRTKR